MVRRIALSLIVIVLFVTALPGPAQARPNESAMRRQVSNYLVKLHSYIRVHDTVPRWSKAWTMAEGTIKSPIWFNYAHYHQEYCVVYGAISGKGQGSVFLYYDSALKAVDRRIKKDTVRALKKQGGICGLMYATEDRVNTSRGVADAIGDGLIAYRDGHGSFPEAWTAELQQELAVSLNGLVVHNYLLDKRGQPLFCLEKPSYGGGHDDYYVDRQGRTRAKRYVSFNTCAEGSKEQF